MVRRRKTAGHLAEGILMQLPEGATSWPRLRMVLPIVLGGIFSTLFALVWTFCEAPARHRRSYQNMELAIMKLADNPPADLAEHQWSYCIYNTWRLHGEFGGVCRDYPGDYYISSADLDRIAAELLVKIEAGPNRATIDWFWDEYLRAAPRAHYEVWRPTSPANRKELEAGACEITRLSWWRSEYKRLSAAK
jgi:hypothetical protein